MPNNNNLPSSSKGKKKRAASSNMLPVARTRAPIASNYRVQLRQPRISMNGKDTVIEGHELIATISGSTAFASTRYRINPGLALYPWLSERARGWEQYRFERLSYDYVHPML